MRLIGLGHYSRTGKDSFANYLCDLLAEYDPRIRVLKRSLAWKLKQITHELYAWDGLREPEFYETPEGAPFRDVKLPTLNLTPVEVWVAFGTPAVRKNVYDGTWLDYLLKTDHKADVLIVPDVRFRNEAEAFKAAGGTLIKVVRPGFGPRKTVADRMLLGYTGWDYVIGDEGTMESLERWASRFANWIVSGHRPVQTAEQKAAALKVEAIEPWEDQP